MKRLKPGQPVDYFTRAFADFKKEHPNCEFKKCQPKTLHDRYIVDKNMAWSVGHTLKDLGSRDSVISPLGHDTKLGLIMLFEERWKNATVM